MRSRMCDKMMGNEKMIDMMHERMMKMNMDKRPEN
jgi:hypothetical protein